MKIALLFLVVLIAGCTTPSEPIHDITLQGHNVVYTFSNDIRESILVEASNESQIEELFQRETRLNVVFDGTYTSDNGLFQLAVVDIFAKLPFFLANSERAMVLNSFFYLDSDNGTQWFDSSNEPIDEPTLFGVVLELRGPNTGATKTSVSLLSQDINQSRILLQGTDRTGISMAADKLTLIIFGISSIEDVIPAEEAIETACSADLDCRFFECPVSDNPLCSNLPVCDQFQKICTCQQLCQ